MDKDLCKAVLRDRGVPVARSVTLRAGDAPENPFGYPVFVKPARLGSSVGISKVHDASELGAAVELARRHDDKVLVEEFVAGVEVECSVLGNRDPVASEVGEIVAHAEWYDYSAKYDEGGMELVVPARISPEADARVRELAVDSFVATECEGMARIDFFVRPDGEVVVNEINTIPGFTATSVYAKLFEATGVSYTELPHRPALPRPAQVNGEHLRELCVWLRLVPVTNRGDVVLERLELAVRPPSQSLHAHLQVLIKADGIRDVPAVQAVLRNLALHFPPERIAEECGAVGVAETPGSSEVVFRPCAADGGELLVAVHEELDLAFAPPAVGELGPGHIGADIVPFALHPLEYHVLRLIYGSD
jgi:hypothetical protein